MRRLPCLFARILPAAPAPQRPDRQTPSLFQSVAGRVSSAFWQRTLPGPARQIGAGLALAALLLAPVSALAQSATGSGNTRSGSAGSANTGSERAVLIADTVRVEGTDLLVADGSVEVLYGTIRMKARRISYDRRGGRLLIDGPIVLVEGTSAILLASAAELSDDLRNGILHSARLVLDDQVQLASDSVRRVDGRYTELGRTVVSSCEVCAHNPVPLWSIRAKRVVHDQQEQKIWFESATFMVGRMPVLWLPRMSLPDPTVRRMSGFLTPEVRTTSQLGYGIKIPYFQTLGESRDLLVKPYVSPRTRTLELRYRQAFTRGSVEFDGAISSDSISNRGSRSYLFGTGVFALPKDFRLSFRVELVSDPAYLLDYGYSGKDRLTSFLRLDRVRRDERIMARVLSFTTLRDDEIPIEDTLPYLQGQALWERRLPGFAGGEARLGLSLDGHQRRSEIDQLGRDVLRLGAEAAWTRTALFGPGIEAELAGKLTVDGYVVGQDSRWPDPFVHAVPAVGATFRWPLAGRMADGGTSIIEPVLQIAWSDSLGTEPPNEDGLLVEFDEGNLLSLDRFPGSDRRETGLRAVLGVTWTRLGPDWSWSLAAGRVFRTEAQSGFTNASGLSGKASDWLLAGRVTWDNRLALTGRLILDDNSGVAKSETRLGFRSDRVSLSLGHVYLQAEPVEGRPDDTNEITFDSDWQASRHWFGGTSFRYDADMDRTNHAGLDIGYRNECVTAALSLSRRFTSSTSVEPTTSVGLTVSLNGFGNDGRPYRRTCRSQ